MVNPALDGLQLEESVWWPSTDLLSPLPGGDRPRATACTVGPSVGDEPLLILSPPSLAVEPGDEVLLRLKVRNQASVVDEFRIKVLGQAAPWATVEPAALSLFPGAEGEGIVRFRPPRSWRTTAGTLPVGIQAISSVVAALSVVEECQLTVTPFCEVSAKLRPRTSRGRLRGRHRLQVRSDGNAPVQVALNAREVDGDCRVEVRPSQLSLAAGQAAGATVTLRPNHMVWLGGSENHSFAAAATPEGGEALRFDGAMRQAPLLSRTVAALAVLGLVAIAAVGL